MNITTDPEREVDGRWIAEALELPGVMCYGATRDAAISSVERLAIEVIADRIAHGELPSQEAMTQVCVHLVGAELPPVENPRTACSASCRAGA